MLFSVLKYSKGLLHLIVILSGFVQLVYARKQRFLGLNGCEGLSALEYECCASVNFANIPPSEYCLNFSLMPNELTLNFDLKLDNESIYSGKLDPSIAPICPPSSPICITVNHVNIAFSEICTKLTAGPLTLIKFPCFGITDGQIFIEQNSFVR